MRALPVADARELAPREAHLVLVEHFGWPDPATEPMPLDELPAALELVGIEADEWHHTLQRAGLAPATATDPWEHA